MRKIILMPKKKTRNYHKRRENWSHSKKMIRTLWNRSLNLNQWRVKSYIYRRLLRKTLRSQPADQRIEKCGQYYSTTTSSASSNWHQLLINLRVPGNRLKKKVRNSLFEGYSLQKIMTIHLISSLSLEKIRSSNKGVMPTTLFPTSQGNKRLKPRKILSRTKWRGLRARQVHTSKIWTDKFLRMSRSLWIVV